MSHYEYCCRGTDEQVVKAREFWEFAFKEFPESHRANLARRFSADDFLQHVGAAFELYFHFFLIRVGCKVIGYEIPVSDSPGGPDFLAITPECPQVMFEVTSVFPSIGTSPSDQLQTKIFNEAGRSLKSDKVWVSLRFIGHATKTPSVSTIISRLRQQLALWDAQVAGDMMCVLEPVKFVANELGIEVEPHVMKPGQVIPTVPFYSSGADLCRTDDAIAATLRTKAKKSYKLSGDPYVVALNVVDPHLDVEAVLNALLGKEQLRVFLGEYREVTGHQLIRHHRGIWQYRGKLTNSRLTAVIVFHNISSLDNQPDTPFAFYNPFVAGPRPLSDVIYMTRFIPDESGEKYVRKLGMSFPAAIRTSS
jgi:hypothetical protein